MTMQQRVLRSSVFGLAVFFLVGLGAWAQSISLTVTTYSDAVRFSAQGSVKELRVEVLSLAGQKVFDSGPVLSNALDWKLFNTQGQPVANGVYLYTVTIKDPFGNVTKKLGKLAILRGKGVAAPPLSGITVGELAAGNPRLQVQWDVPGNYTIQGNLGVGTETPQGKLDVRGVGFFGQPGVFGTLQLTMQAQNNFSDGVRVRKRGNASDINGAVLSGAELGYNSFYGWDGSAYGRGAYFIAKAAENWSGSGHGTDFGIATTPVGSTTNVIRLWVTAAGNVGIGTINPTEKLTVAGVIYSTTGGIKFPDGTIQTTAAAPGTSGWTNDGTTVRLTTSTDNVGIGTSSPSAKTHINNTANQPGLRIDSSAGTNALEIYNTEGGANLIFRVERTTGNVYADGSITGGGADVAERVDASESLEPGDVVEIDPDNPGKFRKAREAISTRVAGVISTAPGVVLGNKDAVTSSDPRPILALAGRVPVKATAKYGAIQVGDLLVSSPIPGYAMKCPEASKCVGAVVGKALEPLQEGVGVIEAQVMLR
jgi:hypothetical protein